MLPVLEQYFPEFAQLFERIASPQIRNMGTIGGNVANASPIGDLPPILLALEARIHCVIAALILIARLTVTVTVTNSLVLTK